MTQTIRLDQKVAAITGGYGHLGSAISQAMLMHGAKVFVMGRSDESFKTLQENTSNAEHLHFVSCDISQQVSVKQAFEAIRQQAGRLDILVNNAFYLKGDLPEKLNDDDFAYGIEGTLNSAYRCIREALAYLPDGGRIINIGSMYGSVSPDFAIYKEHPDFFNPPNYGAAKAGLAQLSRYFANYLGNRQINVNCISPGAFPAPEVSKHESFIAEIKKRTALGRIGKPEDLGGICVLLASDHGSYITGQNIHVDGGWTSR